MELHHRGCHDAHNGRVISARALTRPQRRGLRPEDPVKANLDARAADPAVPLLAWDFYELRRAWNQAKDQVAPWWRCSSKEVYAAGIADLVTALGSWSDAKAGRRAGRPVGFPRFKARRRDRSRVRCTTGAIRIEPDRRHLVVPVIGKLRSKENTRRLERLVAKGRARVLSRRRPSRAGGGSCQSR
jgi:putative transposase